MMIRLDEGESPFLFTTDEAGHMRRRGPAVMVQRSLRLQHAIGGDAGGSTYSIIIYIQSYMLI